MLILIGSVGMGNAQEPAAGIFSVARTAARTQQFSKSEQLGFSIIKTAYSDIPSEGGVLIGFDVQLSKFLDHEIVNAIKPIYATDAGDITTNEFGVFSSKLGKKKNADPMRVLHISAPQGFAVGSITVRHGLFIEGLRLTFHRIKGNALDTKEAAVSDWIGNNKAGHSEKTLGGNGAPIIGIFGNKDERRVLALGVYQLPTAVVAGPRPVPNPRDDRPIAFNGQPEEKKFVFVPNKKPIDDEPMEPADDRENPVIANEEPEAAPKTQDQPAWLALGIFGCVSVVVFLGCWLTLGGKSGNRADTKGQRGVKKTPPPLPAELDEVPVLMPVDSTAVTVKASCPSRVSSDAISAKPLAPPSGFPRPNDLQADVPLTAKILPTYFHARAVYNFKPNRFYRVYVLPEMLLFLDAGPENKDQFKRGIGAAGAATGGILGAMVGLAVGSVIDSTRGDGLDARKKLLDTADTDELIQLSDEGGASFRARLDDLHNARIEPTSTWHTMQHIGNKYVGLLCFHHADKGDMTLEIPTANDMQTALDELPSVFVDDLDVNVILDRQSWQ